jgi:hypothetical protein
VSFFGHVISLEGIVVDPGRVKDVLDWKPPLSITLSAQFFGLVGYYQRLQSQSLSYCKIGNMYVWSKECDEAFLTLKKLLTTSPVLAQPDNAKPFNIYCDASGSGLGCVLMQEG